MVCTVHVQQDPTLIGELLTVGDDGSTIGGMLFADDFVGVSNSLQRLINVAHAYCSNVSKSAVVVFARELVEGSWNWGEQDYQSILHFTPKWCMGQECKNSCRKNISQVHSIHVGCF